MLSKLLAPFLFYKFLLKSRFEEALSCYRSFPKLSSSYVAYACYRLGMYGVVAATPLYDGSNWRTILARAVSLAACGRSEDASVQIEVLLKRKLSPEKVGRIISGLAPFNAEMAYLIAEKYGARPALHGALMLRVGNTEEAKTLFKREMGGELGRVGSELFLLSSNAGNFSAFEKLDLLNNFFSTQTVPEVQLKRKDLPLNSMNVKVRQAGLDVQGPVVSILMTAFNSSERIENAINSIREQTYQSIEIIVVDDASTDNTVEIVQAIVRKDSRVVLLKMPRNVGTYVAKNIALEKATGEFVTCHDSDDWAHPVRIERQVRPLLQDSELVFTTSSWVRICDDGQYYARSVFPLLRMNPASPLFRRKKVLEHAGGWDTVRTGADSEFVARLKLVFGRHAMMRIVQPLTLGSHRHDSLMTSKDTGYSENGTSPTRLKYWESWTLWHIEELRAGRKPQLEDVFTGPRRYDAPESIIVPYADIEYCLHETE